MFGQKIAELVAEIKTDTKGLQTGLKQADTKMQGFGNSVMKHNKAIGASMTAMGAAILGMGAMIVKSYADMGDQVQKMADRTGFATETLSELRHAAELSGTSLDSVEKGIKKMQKTLVDADTGLETYVRSFDRLGLSVEDLMALSPEQQFDTITKALADMEDPTLRAATAQEVFGRAGTQLLPMLAQGAEGIEAMKQEARDMGIVFDRDAADAAAALKDSMTRLKGSLAGVGNTIAESLVPKLTVMVEKVAAIATKITDWTEAHPKLSKTLLIVAGALGAVMAVLGPLLMILPALISGISAFGVALNTAIWPITLIVAAIAGLIAAGIALYKNWDSVVNFCQRAWISIKNFFLEGVDFVLKVLEKFTTFLPGFNAKITEARENLRDMIDGNKVEKDALKAEQAIRKLTKATEGYNEVAVTYAEDVAPVVVKGLTGSADAATIFGDALLAIQKKMDAVSAKAPEETAPKASTGGGGGGGGDLTGDYGFIEWLFEEIWGGVGDFEVFKKGIESGKIGIPSALMDEWAHILDELAGLGELGAGGIVTSPMAAIIGEKGPEAVIPLDRAGAMGGVTVNFTDLVVLDNEESINRLARKIYELSEREQRFQFGGALT